MQVTLRRWGAVIGAIALAGLMGGLPVGAPMAQQPARAADLAGTWLIEPDHYDFWAERGIEIAAYPVLRIHQDGRFTLYRLMGLCHPARPDGGSIGAEDPLAYIEACAEARARSATDGIVAGFAHLSAAGTWAIDAGNRLRFASTTLGPELKEWNDTLVELVQGGDFTPAKARQYKTFHTTMFLFDGDPVLPARNDDLLALTDAARQVIEYRAYRPEVLDAAMAIIGKLSVTSAIYFRCLVARVDKEWPATGEPASELGKLAVLARQDEAMYARFTLIQARLSAGRATPEERAWVEANLERIRQAGGRLVGHPAGKAAEDRQFGAYLGCPERDQLQ